MLLLSCECSSPFFSSPTLYPILSSSDANGINNFSSTNNNEKSFSFLCSTISPRIVAVFYVWWKAESRKKKSKVSFVVDASSFCCLLSIETVRWSTKAHESFIKLSNSVCFLLAQVSARCSSGSNFQSKSFEVTIPSISIEKKYSSFMILRIFKN